MMIMITGSRYLQDKQLVSTVLSHYDQDDVVLIHGAAKGADSLAHEVAQELGWSIIEFPADWSLGAKAGPLRNQAMIDMVPDVVIAFPLDNSKGTWDSVNRAIHERIPVHIVHNINYIEKIDPEPTLF